MSSHQAFLLVRYSSRYAINFSMWASMPACPVVVVVAAPAVLSLIVAPVVVVLTAPIVAAHIVSLVVAIAVVAVAA